ncbi:NUDIX domain-containing protein [Streptomyces sp. NPDC014894]|uniref:NUDIX hydrolase n=1 Tax=Streptomyces sp. NPDC014894 TaxID=3364931 RepID=UPI0036FF4A34
MHDPSEPQGAAVLLVNPAGQYLLHLRDANKPHICDPGTWSIPGGGRESGETAFEAAERELSEETGLAVRGLIPFTVVESVGPDGHTKGRIQVYLGAWDGDADALPVTEGIMYRWFDTATIAYLTMCPWAQRVIDLHRAERPLPPPRTDTAAAPVNRTRPHIVGVHLYLERDGQVLLGLRHPDSSFAGSIHHFLAGHCEQEPATGAVVREAWEEAGLRIRPEDLELVHVVHTPDRSGGLPRVQLVFRARAWDGEAVVREPDQCAGWAWWPLDALPEPIVPYTRAAIEGIRAGRVFTELGWT